MKQAVEKGVRPLHFLRGLTPFLSFLVWATAVEAQVPRLIAYQGRLTEADGDPLTGEHTVIFRVYDAETGGSTLWEEEHSVAFEGADNGVFSIILGSLSSFGSLDFNHPLWLSLEVDGEGEMTPRSRLTAVGYALNADTLDGLDSDQFLRSDALADLNASNLSSGTVPDARLSTNVSLLGSSIESAEVTNGTLTAGDLASDSVGADELANSAIQAGDIEAGDLPALGRASTSASSTLAIGTSDTTLLSVTVNKASATSALLILASVTLSHGSGGGKAVSLKLRRDGTVLDSGYTATLKSGDQTVAGLHSLDSSGSGTHTIDLQASADNIGANATVRRLTVVELP